MRPPAFELLNLQTVIDHQLADPRWIAAIASRSADIVVNWRRVISAVFTHAPF